MPVKPAHRSRNGKSPPRQDPSRPFDILAGARALPYGGWVQFFPLQGDPSLHAAGVEIGAKVHVPPDKNPSLRIVFRAGDKEDEVTCVHVAVYAGSLESLPPDAELAHSTEGHPIHLPPEEHFFALKSYVAGIAEVGLGAMFAIARDAKDLSVGFNALMQEQILNALFFVAPAATFDFCQWVLDDMTRAGGDRHSESSFSRLVEQTLSSILDEELNIIPHELFACLARYEDGLMNLVIASDYRTPPEVLADLAKDKDEDVRKTVARSEHTPPEILTRLAEDENVNVRVAVVGNCCTPSRVLARLAMDDDVNVRQHVVDGNNISLEVLWCLARDSNVKVRLKVASREGNSFEVFWYLTGILSYLAEDEEKDVRAAVARHHATTPETLARLGEDIDAYVREGVARNDFTLPETLVRLASDKTQQVREAVARNKHTLSEVLSRLASNKDE